MPRYRKPERNAINPYKAQPLPLGRPVAVYYRQSTEGQIGNISTTLQTVDMVEHLMNQGWQHDQIIVIDMDGSISGTKKIKERPGMSYLYDLIEENAIRLVVSQDAAASPANRRWPSFRLNSSDCNPTRANAVCCWKHAR